MRPRVIALCLSLTLLQGCSSAQHQGDVNERFRTNILDNGTKLFFYEFSRGEKIRTLLPYDQKGGFTDGRDVYSAEELRRKNQRYLNASVTRKLEQTGYCREGFYTLDTLVGYANASLRGECREAASDEDRQRFAADKK